MKLTLSSRAPSAGSTNLHRRIRSLVAALAGVALIMTLPGPPLEAFPGGAGFGNLAAPPAGNGESQAAARDALANLPLYFVANKGQVDERVDYYVEGRDTTVYFTPRGITFALREDPATGAARRWAVKLDFVDANRVAPVGRWRTPATVSYFKGSPDQWRAGLPTYSEIVYRELWPGIDLVYSGKGYALKYSFVVHPGADPSDIRMNYRGANVAPTTSGKLRVSTPLGSFTDGRPLSYQRVGGHRVTVGASYALSGTGSYGFDMSYYDRKKTLVIDPIVTVYAGYIGGSGDEVATDIAVDPPGNAYVTGWTDSIEPDFPVTAGPDLNFNGGFEDAFVAKISADGTALVYLGYIGGTGDDWGDGIAVDTDGNAYVSGGTESTEASFPVTFGPDEIFNGQMDAFVAKVDATGAALSYAGYIGGSDVEEGTNIAVDSTGHAYVTGYTESSEASFPVVVGPYGTYSGLQDAFVAKVSDTGGTLEYAGYIGGTGFEAGLGIAIDAADNAFITGWTDSNEASFPATGGPDLSFNGIGDAFVAKVRADGTALDYAGYIGGADDEVGFGIALDAAGNAYVSGWTESTEASFPVAVGPDLTFNGGGVDAFVAKVIPDGTALVYAGYIGGADSDIGGGIAVDLAGNAYVTGATGFAILIFRSSNYANYPMVARPGAVVVLPGGFGAFLAKINADGSLFDASYLDDSSLAVGIALDPAGDIYVTGYTAGDFPVTVGPDLSYNGGDADAFVAKVQVVAPPPPAGDTTPPVTTIDSGPAELTNDSTPTFTFHSSEDPSTFTCRVDEEAFAACSSPHTTAALADGDHTFEVRARDRWGNTDPTPALAAFTVDTGLPETSIDSGPNDKIADHTPTFTFSADEPATFACRRDDEATFASCDSPFTSPWLPDGTHTFEVVATDVAGNVDPTPATATYEIDTKVKVTSEVTMAYKAKTSTFHGRVTTSSEENPEAADFCLANREIHLNTWLFHPFGSRWRLNNVKQAKTDEHGRWDKQHPGFSFPFRYSAAVTKDVRQVGDLTITCGWADSGNRKLTFSLGRVI